MKNGDRINRSFNLPLHFWIIVIMLNVFILIYNANFIDITGWFPWSKEAENVHGTALFVLSFIFLIPIVYASIIYGIKGALLTWFSFLAGTLPRTISEIRGIDDGLRFALFAIVALFMGLLISLTRHWMRREQLIRAQIAPRRWSSVGRILKAQENERKRISRELHEGVIQDLLVIANHIHAVETGVFGKLPADAAARTEQIENEILRAIDKTRKMSHGLTTSVLNNEGLVPALRWLTDNTAQESGISISLTVNGKEHKLRQEAETIIFRIAQEALNNIKLHSRATRADVILDFAARGLKLTLIDNGVGFKVSEDILSESSAGQLGLDVIKQRTKLLGGRLNIQSEPGTGTELTVEVDI